VLDVIKDVRETRTNQNDISQEQLGCYEDDSVVVASSVVGKALASVVVVDVVVVGVNSAAVAASTSPPSVVWLAAPDSRGSVTLCDSSAGLAGSSSVDFADSSDGFAASVAVGSAGFADCMQRRHVQEAKETKIKKKRKK
jgi:hypothetical protein